MSQCLLLDRDSTERLGRMPKTAISNVSRVFSHIFQSTRQRARSVKCVTVSERLHERRWRRIPVEGGRLRVEVIYTRDHCHCTFRRKLHGFMKYRDREHSSLSPSSLPPSSPLSLLSFLSFHCVFFFLSSIRTLFICLSISTSVYFSIRTPFSASPFLLHVSFYFSLLHRPVYFLLHCSFFVCFTSNIISSSSWTRIMWLFHVTFVPGAIFSFSSAWQPISSSCFAKRNKVHVDGILCRVRS